MPTSYNLRIEVSGLCVFVVLDKDDAPEGGEPGLHALLVADEDHVSRLMVHENLNPAGCKGKFDSKTSGDRYHVYPLSGLLRWPATVRQSSLMDLPSNLINISDITGESVRRDGLASQKATALIPLIFAEMQSVLLPGRFNRHRDLGNVTRKTRERLFHKVAFDTTVTGALDLNVGNGCTVHLEPQHNLEIRIKNVPKDAVRGRDPRPGDSGDPTHFRMLYEVFNNPPPIADRWYPISDLVDSSDRMEIKSSLYTCMPGGGS